MNRTFGDIVNRLQVFLPWNPTTIIKQLAHTLAARSPLSAETDCSLDLERRSACHKRGCGITLL